MRMVPALVAIAADGTFNAALFINAAMTVNWASQSNRFYGWGYVSVSKMRSWSLHVLSRLTEQVQRVPRHHTCLDATALDSQDAWPLVHGAVCPTSHDNPFS